MNIHFRPLTEDDIPQMHAWLNTDFVRQYWKKPASLGEVEKKYGAYISGEKPTKPFIIMMDGDGIGYIQTYFYSDYPGEYYDSLDADKHSAGVDLFIGHGDYIHKGHGAHILRAFITEHVFANPDVVNVVITPEPGNAIAIRVYEKVGFKWYKTITNSDDGGQEYLMSLSSEGFC